MKVFNTLTKLEYLDNKIKTTDKVIDTRKHPGSVLRRRKSLKKITYNTYEIREDVLLELLTRVKW